MWACCVLAVSSNSSLGSYSYEFRETCHSVIFIVLVNSHQRWKQTRNRVCFHLWCELTIVNCRNHIWWNLLPVNIRKGDFHEIKCDGRTSFHGIHDLQNKYIWNAASILWLLTSTDPHMLIAQLYGSLIINE